jgi:hypothetical protein
LVLLWCWCVMTNLDSAVALFHHSFLFRNVEMVFIKVRYVGYFNTVEQGFLSEANTSSPRRNNQFHYKQSKYNLKGSHDGVQSSYSLGFWTLSIVWNSKY